MDISYPLDLFTYHPIIDAGTTVDLRVSDDGGCGGDGHLIAALLFDALLRPSVKTQAFFFGKHHPGTIIVGKYGDDTIFLADHRGNPVGGVSSAKHVQCAGEQGQNARSGPALGQHRPHAVVIWVLLAAQVAAILEFPTLLRFLKQQRGGEFRSVEMPIQRLAMAIVHDIHTGERILHQEEVFLVHNDGEEIHQGLPSIDVEQWVIRQLVGTKHAVGGFKTLQGRVVVG